MEALVGIDIGSRRPAVSFNRADGILSLEIGDTVFQGTAGHCSTGLWCHRAADRDEYSGACRSLKARIACLQARTLVFVKGQPVLPDNHLIMVQH